MKKEQQFFIDSHKILVVQCYVDYLLKTPFQNIAHFSLIEDGFVFFHSRRGISLIPREKKVFTVTAAVCLLKGRFTFLERPDYLGQFSISCVQ